MRDEQRLLVDTRAFLRANPTLFHCLCVERDEPWEHSRIVGAQIRP